MVGKGTEVDLGKARYWFERAAAKGDEVAIHNLKHLDAQV
jgi:TPR repeat protein